MDTSHHLLLLLLFLQYAIAYSMNCVKILPDSESKIPVEVGRSFTATCHLMSSDFTLDDIEWFLENTSIPKSLYHKINETSVSVTVNISSNLRGWLLCKASKTSLTYIPPCSYGISLFSGYAPLKPQNLTCIALQEGKSISPKLECSWDPGSRDPLIVTTYTLNAELVLGSDLYSNVCNQRLARSCTVDLSTFPVHMKIRVWVEVKNAVGSVRSEELVANALDFVKPNPPLDVTVIAENNFSTSLLVTWKPSIDKDAMRLFYVIRYCRVDSSVWTEVPYSNTRAQQGSFRLLFLEPYTSYAVQMRCFGEHDGYWSDWSPNVTARTTEAKPASAPDLWRIIQPTSDNRKILLVWKPPVKANGEILHYDLEISKDAEIVEKHFLRANSPSQNYSMELPPNKTANIVITAANSVGESPETSLFIPRSDTETPAVENVSCRVHNKQLHVQWSPPIEERPSEYLVEWLNSQLREPRLQWLRVPNKLNTTNLSGLEAFKRYNISVYSIYKYRKHHILHIQAARPATTTAYIQQGSPEKGPSVTVTKSKKNSAVLTWDEIPLDSQRGFITNYTIFYKTGNTEQWQSVTLDWNVRSHVLTDLASEMDYVVHVMASTVAGSKNGSDFNFKTVKYDDGEVEVIVVVVCLGFLFLTVFIIMICLRKREVIKQLFWPQVPDPSDSSIAHWSPDFPIKADMPKEDVSVVEVDVFDRKSLCEEDKAVLPLKKDKYLSEEHSSGIGGSSCMSSPRHSVSDSDESDSGQTTASTVQYSSVVASGYKGQTPNHQPPVFARSESTQPLLDCEEHPDHLNESAGHSRNSYFRRGRELEPDALVQECDEPNGSTLSFCPVQEEEASPAVEDSPTSTLSYMPQKSGYRPQ